MEINIKENLRWAPVTWHCLQWAWWPPLPASLLRRWRGTKPRWVAIKSHFICNPTTRPVCSRTSTGHQQALLHAQLQPGFLWPGRAHVRVEQVETYVGSCATDWKTRKGNHQKSFDHERYKSETILSSHIWAIRARGSSYTLAWRILDRGAPFNHVTKTCMLCCMERFFIIRRPDLASLNSRQEVGNHCLHIASSLLKTVAKVKV